MIAFEATIKEVVGDIWGIVDGSPIWENYSDKRFKTIFRVSRKTFTNILGFIRDDLQYEYLCETPISPEERLGICLYRLGCGDYYQTISELTGCGIVTVRNITQEVSNLILTKLWKKFVVFSKTAEEELCNGNFMAVSHHIRWSWWLSYSTKVPTWR